MPALDEASQSGDDQRDPDSQVWLCCTLIIFNHISSLSQALESDDDLPPLSPPMPTLDEASQSRCGDDERDPDNQVWLCCTLYYVSATLFEYSGTSE